MGSLLTCYRYQGQEESKKATLQQKRLSGSKREKPNAEREVRGCREHVEYKEEERKKKKEIKQALRDSANRNMCYMIIKPDKEASGVKTTRL